MALFPHARLRQSQGKTGPPANLTIAGLAAMHQTNFPDNGKAKTTSICFLSLLKSLKNTVMKMARNYVPIIQHIDFETSAITRCGDRNF